ncbi:hypothetical protein MMC26_004708 [Xylographa opegraphella]|nr:hypothetical protein [Xylographa opegraphella]
MSVSTQFQLGLELTKIFPIREVAGSVYNKVMNYARDLRKTGSDLVVEEDLAAIFGRGRLEASLELKFREEVLKDMDFIPIQHGSEIGVDTRPGPTLNRALREKDRYYLSAVVQLSLLGWFHKRADLAAALTECMRKRFTQKLPDSRPDPGYEGILGTLYACSSQTSNFPWNLYTQQVQAKLSAGFQQSISAGVHIRHPSLNTIPPHTLLAFMDYLYLVQAFPEERKIRVSNQNGLVPLVIWAHHLLSLTVVVRGIPGGDVRFGVDPSPQVSILWKSDYGGRYGLPADVSLLDSAMSVVLRVDRKDIKLHSISHYERHPVRDYGTTWLRRKFNSYCLISDDDPLFQEVVQLLVAMAIIVSKRLVHVHSRDGFSSLDPVKEKSSPSRTLEVDRWAIYEAAAALFSDIHFARKQIESYVSKIADTRILADVPQPSCLESYLKRRPETGVQGANKHTYTEAELDLLVLIILTFAIVPSLQDCAEMPISLSHHPLRRTKISKRLFTAEGHIPVDEADFFEVAAMLLAPEVLDIEKPESRDSFLISDFGWSLSLHNVGDNDPATVGIGRYCFKKGVPINVQTGERKYRMRDLGQGEHNIGFADSPLRILYDRGDSYLSRSAAIVSTRIVEYSTIADAFLLNLDYQLVDLTVKADEELTPDELYCMQHPQLTSGFRALYRSLWRVHIGPSCDHQPHPEHPLPLRMDMVTASALDWATEGTEEDPDGVAERIAICLTKGDRHMRWLAVQAAALSPVRQTMLRGDGCEECTVDVVARLPGKWIVVL